MWKRIPSFPNYLINTDGIIMNDKYRVISAYTDRYGYKACTLFNNKIKKNRTIHSLVLEAFLRERKNGEQVNHINGNKEDNSLENLEYCTASENLKHAYKNGLKSARGSKNSQSKLSEKDVLEIKLLLGKISQKEIAIKFNIDQSTVSNIKTGKLWSHVV